ncbi:hypothetical protein NLJ89_g6138 [Agrocybe chaxingu]|uniref:Uncharacterized protein n=1 Tax=Agrocybe chaxingu TaxID=84603 RepID=A0A9W8JZ87_9AGAR|nr:hypothetical protein NLJ89_g6138 [Agrocybe chaxingu]
MDAASSVQSQFSFMPDPEPRFSLDIPFSTDKDCDPFPLPYLKTPRQESMPSPLAMADYVQPALTEHRQEPVLVKQAGRKRPTRNHLHRIPQTTRSPTPLSEINLKHDKKNNGMGRTHRSGKVSPQSGSLPSASLPIRKRTLDAKRRSAKAGVDAYRSPERGQIYGITGFLWYRYESKDDLEAPPQHGDDVVLSPGDIFIHQQGWQRRDVRVWMWMKRWRPIAEGQKFTFAGSEYVFEVAADFSPHWVKPSTIARRSRS